MAKVQVIVTFTDDDGGVTVGLSSPELNGKVVRVDELAPAETLALALLETIAEDFGAGDQFSITTHISH